MIKYIRLYDGKEYSSYEECEKDATSIFIEFTDKVHDDTDAVVSKHKKAKKLFKLKGE